MSISTLINRVGYAGNGSSASFSFPYEFFAQADLKVFLYQSAVIQAQTLNTHYTVGGTANAQGVYTSGGTVITTCAIATGTLIVITRDPSQVQNYTLLQNGAINSVALVQQLDYLTLLAQRLKDQTSRSVALKDGYGDSFDPTLPAVLATSAGKRLIVNSSATGFVFDDFYQSWIPNTLAYAITGSSLASLPGAATGLVLTSNGSSAPTWQSVSFSGSSATGTVSVANGGTGGLVPQQWGVVFASSATQLATTPPAPTGVPLISNASSSPTFQQMNLASAGSGILPTVNGGTGLSTPFNSPGVLFAPTSTTFGVIAPAASGFVLTANGSSAPTFQAATGGAPAGSSALLVVNNLSDVTSASASFKNISPMTTRGDIIFAGSGVIATRLGAGASTFILTANGAGADPSWQAAPAGAPAGSSALLVVNNLNDVASVTTSFKNINPMTTFGDIIYAGSSVVGTRLGAGTAGQILQTQGVGAAPSWATLVTSSAILGISTKTASYNAANTDDVILCNSSAMTINLYGVSGNTGRSIKIKKVDASRGIITIAGSSATIDGTSMILCAQYDAVQLLCDGTNWQIIDLQLAPIMASYSNTAGTSIANSGENLVPFATKTYDIPSVNFATDSYTIPFTGRYNIYSHLNFASAAYALSNGIYNTIYKNSSVIIYGPINLLGGAATGPIGVPVSTDLSLLAGDVITVHVLNNRTAGATSLSSTAGQNVFQIKRISNP